MEKLHSVEDLAEAFGIPVSTVRDLCRRHKWPHLKVGRATRFTEAQVEEILRIQTVQISPYERKVLDLMSRTGQTRKSAQAWVRKEEEGERFSRPRAEPKRRPRPRPKSPS